MGDRSLTRIHSVRERVGDSLAAHTNDLVALFSRLISQGKGMLQPHQLMAEYEAVISEEERKKLKDSAFEDVIRAAQEAIVMPPWVALAIRPRPGVWEYVRLNVTELRVEELTVPEYLQFKEQLVEEKVDNNFVLELDFEPFNASFPRPSLSKSIGNGVQFLNRHLSAKLFHDKESMYPLLNFLRQHHYNGTTMMLNDRIQSLSALQSTLRKAEKYLSSIAQDTPYSEFTHRFQELGLEKGWGDTAQRVYGTIHLLLDLLEAPDPCTLERFLSTIPMVFNVVILSPHGYFAQANVLGYPDTGGQVVYILDQVRALEDEMLLRIKQQGLSITPKILIVTRLLPDAVGTTCGQRLEKVLGTEHTQILRVPFRSEKGILRKWISRFEVWPYLETYTEDVANELARELQATPDLIIATFGSKGSTAALDTASGETSQDDGVQNITVRLVAFTGTQKGLRIKTWGKPSNGFVSGVTFKHTVMRNVKNSILVDQNYCPGDVNCPNQKAVIWAVIWLSFGIRERRIKEPSHSKVEAR